ncbi:MAG: dockerin type I domain-containing protein [Oscillospiraceae bacterium]|nr:dockerin type I domain-containing protein [Oscillospiraceae bacterium]
MKKLTAVLLIIIMLVSLPITAAASGFTTADALAILRHVAGIAPLSEADFARYDLNGDGKVDSADALFVLRIVAGIAPAPKPEPTQTIPMPILNPTQTETGGSSGGGGGGGGSGNNNSGNNSGITLPNRRLTDAEREQWIDDYWARGGHSNFELEVVRLINEIRAEHNLSQLEICDILMMSARFFTQQHSNLGGKVALEPGQGHNFGPYASDPNALHGASANIVRAFGGQLRWNGGNLSGAGVNSFPEFKMGAEAVVSGWMNSSGHRAYIMSPEHKYIGAGSFGNYSYLFMSDKNKPDVLVLPEPDFYLGTTIRTFTDITGVESRYFDDDVWVHEDVYAATFEAYKNYLMTIESLNVTTHNFGTSMRYIFAKNNINIIAIEYFPTERKATVEIFYWQNTPPELTYYPETNFRTFTDVTEVKAYKFSPIENIWVYNDVNEILFNSYRNYLMALIDLSGTRYDLEGFTRYIFKRNDEVLITIEYYHWTGFVYVRL